MKLWDLLSHIAYNESKICRSIFLCVMREAVKQLNHLLSMGHSAEFFAIAFNYSQVLGCHSHLLYYNFSPCIFQQLGNFTVEQLLVKLLT